VGCMRVCLLCARMGVCASVGCVSVRVRAQAHVCARTCVHKHTHLCVYACASEHACAFERVPLCLFASTPSLGVHPDEHHGEAISLIRSTHTHTHMHTHTHTTLRAHPSVRTRCRACLLERRSMRRQPCQALAHGKRCNSNTWSRPAGPLQVWGHAHKQGC